MITDECFLSASTCELILGDCRVPKANILGEVGKGYKVAIETLNEGRIGIGAQMIGIAKGALACAVNYTKERKQFGKAIMQLVTIAKQLLGWERVRVMPGHAPRLSCSLSSQSLRPEGDRRTAPVWRAAV